MGTSYAPALALAAVTFVLVGRTAVVLSRLDAMASRGRLVSSSRRARRWLRRWSRVRAARLARRDVAEALALLVAELEAGTVPDAALRAAAGIAPAHAAALLAAADALLADEEPSTLMSAAELRAIGHAWRISRTTGAPLATVIDEVARDLTARETVRGTAITALAGPRASCALLAALPLLGLALGGAMGAHPLHFLFGSLAGRLVCAAGVLLDLVGVLWARAIMRRALP